MLPQHTIPGVCSVDKNNRLGLHASVDIGMKVENQNNSGVVDHRCRQPQDVVWSL